MKTGPCLPQPSGYGDNSPPKTAVGDLVRQGVLAGVDVLRKEVRFVQEFGRLETRQVAIQRLLRQIGNGLQQR